MNANTVTAICAVVIAVASLAVSIFQARATRQHNRHSMRPILQVGRVWHVGERGGLRLVNVGLGPAVIVSSTVSLDGTVIGSWGKSTADQVREGLPVRPSAVTFADGAVIPVGYEQFLLSVAGYDPKQHAEVVELVDNRLTVEIRYESLYGGENYLLTQG